jgi:hypothetical protein
MALAVSAWNVKTPRVPLPPALSAPPYPADRFRARRTAGRATELEAGRRKGDVACWAVVPSRRPVERKLHALEAVGRGDFVKTEPQGSRVHTGQVSDRKANSDYALSGLAAESVAHTVNDGCRNLHLVHGSTLPSWRSSPAARLFAIVLVFAGTMRCAAPRRLRLRVGRSDLSATYHGLFSCPGRIHTRKIPVNASASRRSAAACPSAPRQRESSPETPEPCA